jgi:hypothetical protein
MVEVTSKGKVPDAIEIAETVRAFHEAVEAMKQEHYAVAGTPEAAELRKKK